MDMFENYRLTPDDYIPSNLHYDNRVPTKPKYPLVAYNIKDEPIGYTWNYGDSICLEFTTTGNVVYDNQDVLPGTSIKGGFMEDAETYLQGKIFRLEFYDFRYNVVACCSFDAAPFVRVLSESFQSIALVKGVYHLKLTLLDNKEKQLATLLSGDDCIIYIK